MYIFIGIVYKAFDSLREWRSNEYCVIVVMLQDHVSSTLTHDDVWYVMNMVSLLCWLKGYIHEHSMNNMWKVYSYADGSKVERTFSSNKSMSCYDDMLLSFHCTLWWTELKYILNMNFKRNYA